MNFQSIIGQQTVKKKLIESVLNNRISHAQFFLGPDGSGALQLAIAYAQYILCENKSTDDSCGSCNACQKNLKLIHPDVHFTFPVVREKDAKRPPLSKDYLEQWRNIVSTQPYFSLNDWYEKIKSENKTGNITADECYEIVRTLNLKAYESEYKIFIIWKPQLFGKEGNILLKSLEEPNGKTVFILVDESEELVLSTIISRTQIIKIPRLTDAEVMHALMANQNIPESDARKLARFSEGNYSVALSEMDHSEDISEKMLQEWIKTSRSMNIISLNEWIDAFVKLGREKQKVFIRFTLDFLRDCIITQTIGVQHSRLREEEISTANWVAANINLEVLQQWAEMLEQTHFHIERNANPRVQMMSDSLKMYKILNNKSIEA